MKNPNNMNKIQHILLIMVLVLITSCNNHLLEKKLSGVYIADFKGFKGVSFNLTDTVFSKSERKYYSDFKLFVNYNKTFHFSKPFYNMHDTISGYWERFPDPLSDMLATKGENVYYHSVIRPINR